jgi:molybdopterin/thiamine biosynthesis adenylyltransferase
MRDPHSILHSILIVGIGGLGVPAALTIARAGGVNGVGRLGLMDPDPVEETNLPRQIIYNGADIGSPKVEAAARHLHEIDSALVMEKLPVALDADNAREIFARFDFVIDGTDSPATKFLINDVGIATATPFVYGGVLGLTGQVMTVIPGRTACLRCLFEGAPDPSEVASCREAGILGPVAGAIGNLQAREALAIIAGRPAELAGGILTYDGAGPARIRFTMVNPRPRCGCGAFERALAGNDAAPRRQDCRQAPTRQ